MCSIVLLLLLVVLIGVFVVSLVSVSCYFDCVVVV